MTQNGNLWAVVFDDPAAAERARAVVRALQDFNCLRVDDVAIVTQLPDGSFKFDRETCPVVAVTTGFGLLGFLVGLIVGQPLVGAALGALTGGSLAVAAARLRISNEFVLEVEAVMIPGAVRLFGMDEWGARE